MPPETKSFSILIVDDDRDALILLDRQLKHAGYEVIAAADGEEAMQVLLTEGPRIVITDWMMPGMSGLDLCRAIRSHEGIGFTFVTVITAQQPSEDLLVQAFDAGADDYLCKPLQTKELLARLRAGERIIHLKEELDSQSRQVHRYSAEMEIANSRLAVANEDLNRMATTDELTGLLNRREALARLGHQWPLTLRHDAPFACIALDIDHFKVFNDTHGHAVGDLVLKETARVLQESSRQEEDLCRVGGEEFLVLCPYSTEEMASVCAERLRKAVEDNLVMCGDLALKVTVSIGVSERTAQMQAPDDMLSAADVALYAAKDAGRNVVCLASASRKKTAPDGDKTSRPTESTKPDVEDQYPASLAKALIVALAKLAEHRDSDTGRHVDRVCRYSVLLADALRETPKYADVITDAFVADLECSVPLHDIGKVVVPDHILIKAGALTPAERAVMQIHTTVGAKTIRSVCNGVPDVGFLRMAEDVAHAHHEWHDGNGYPRGLSGDTIPLCAQIFAVADAYDAITTKRAYKESLTHAEAVELIGESCGTQFAPDVVRAFRDCADEFGKIAAELADQEVDPVFPSSADLIPPERFANARSSLSSDTHSEPTPQSGTPSASVR